MDLLSAALMFVLAVIVVAPAAAAEQAQATAGLRVLYASDWSGTMQIYAAYPTGRLRVRQLTFARPDGSCHWAAACGYTRPLPSPDGRRLVYWSTPDRIGEPSTLWLAGADGSDARVIAHVGDAAWAPDSRRLAYSAADGIHVQTVGGADRLVAAVPSDVPYADDLRWSPDGRSLAFVDASRGLVVLHDGRQRVLSPAASALSWSRDGRRIAFVTGDAVFVLPVSGGAPRLVYRPLAPGSDGSCWSSDLHTAEVAFSPNGRLLAFDLDGIPGFIDTRTWRARTVADRGHGIAWSPDSRRLLFVQGCEDASGDVITGGGLQTITPDGHVRTLLAATGDHGGQIVAAAWATVPTSVGYRPAEPVSGIFAGGPVQKLAADGDRLAYASCGRVDVWKESTGLTDGVEPWSASSARCWSPFARSAHVGALALAGVRVLWWYADLGLSFRWSMNEYTLPDRSMVGGEPVELATGFGNLGGTPDTGKGTAVGGGSLLVMSSWTYPTAYVTPRTVDEQTVDLVEPGGCPCPALSSSPGPYTPLDVDGGRVVVSGENETRVLAADGSTLLALSVPTLAAQLSGSQLVVTTGNELRVYDTDSGARVATWPLPAGPAGHDCDLYADPSCDIGSPATQLTLEDVSHGLAAYVYAGQVHVLRLSDGLDKIVGYGTIARFMNAGLAVADGARIWRTSYSRLPLQ